MGTTRRSKWEFCLAAWWWYAWLDWKPSHHRACCQFDLGGAGNLQESPIAEMERSVCTHGYSLCPPSVFWYMTAESCHLSFSWKWRCIPFCSIEVDFLLVILASKGKFRRLGSLVKATPVVWHLNLFQSKRDPASSLALVRILQELSIQAERNIVRLINTNRFLQMQLALLFWCRYGFS